MLKKILNIVFFQAAWWGLVLSASAGREEIGYRIAAAYMLYHFIVEVPKGKKQYELAFVTIVGSAGFALDGLFHQLKFIVFLDAAFAPFWLFMLWLCFACTVRYGLLGMLENRWVALGAGAVFGPLSYGAGEGFHLLVFPAPAWHGYVLYAITWAALMLGFSWYVVKKSPGSAGPGAKTAA